MRKITILEVWDPAKKEFIPIRQAINQGLFNTRTYLFFSPDENKHYSITEAARKGLFKSAIDLRPEALVVERVKVAETVVLEAARDPADEAHLIGIRDAIAAGIVDPNLRIYRNPNTNEVLDLGDAIDSDLVKVRIIRETTEKITETLTEQKTTDNLGLIKKIETRNFVSESAEAEEDEAAAESTAAAAAAAAAFDSRGESQSEDYSSLNGDSAPPPVKQLADDLYIFDRTKSYNISKRMKKYDDEVAAGFITDYDSKRIINQSKSQENSSPSKILVPIPDFTEAVAKNLIILPDSLCLTQNVQYVVDTSTGNKFDFDAACDIGLIDVNSKRFFDTRRNKPMSLFDALEKNFIVMKDELGTNYDEEDLGVDHNARLKRKDLKTLFNPKTGNQVPVQKAIQLGIYDEKRNVYVDLVTKRVMSLEDAVDRGLVVLRQDKYQNKVNEGYQFLNITGILDPMTRQPMTLNEAIESGLLDHAECEFRDPSCGKTLTLLEAYDRGYLLTSAKTYLAPVSASNANDDEPAPTEIPLARVVKIEAPPSSRGTTSTANERLSRRDELERTKAAGKTAASPTTTTTASSDRLPATKRKMLTKSETVTGGENSAGFGGSVNNEPTMTRSQTLGRSFDQSLQQQHHRRDLSLVSGVSTVTTATTRTSKLRGGNSIDNKSVDRMSTSSRRSMIIKLREKFFGRKSKSNRFDEELIMTSLKVMDTRSTNKLTLDEAVKLGLVFGDNRIRDTLGNTDYSVNDAIAKGVIKFFHPINNFEFKYALSCYIFNNEWLLLINYVLDPLNRRKIGLKNAFLNMIIDKENNVFHTKKGPIALFKAIDKGYICCEMIEMQQLDDIIMSRIVQLGGSVEATIKTTRTSLDSPTSSNAANNNELTASRDEENDALLKAIFKRADLKYDTNKSYAISEVLDTLNDRFVSLKKAQFMGIINLSKNEFVDTRTGIKLDIMTAIRTNKIRLEDTLNLEQIQPPTTATNNQKRTVQSTMSRSIELNNSNDFDNGGNLSRYQDLNSSSETRSRVAAGAAPLRAAATTTAVSSSSPSSSVSPRGAGSSNGGVVVGRGSSTPRIIDDSSPPPPTMAEQNGHYESMSSESAHMHSTLKKTSSTSGIYANERSGVDSLSFESFKNALESRMNGINGGDHHQVPVISVVDEPTNAPDETSNFAKCLLYKKVSNGKYVRFETVVKNGLYDTATGKIKDAYSTDMLDIMEALQNGTLRLNDSNYMFDDARIYHIETVLVSSNGGQQRHISMADAAVKGLVDKKRCTVKYSGADYGVREALRRGYVEGKVLTSYEIKWLLDASARRVLNRLGGSNKSLEKIESRDAAPETHRHENNGHHNGHAATGHPLVKTSSTNRLQGVPIDSFSEFYIFDPDSERYVPLSKAFYTGIILNEPVRIKDPSSSNYILLKDAVVKGLLSCEKSDKRVLFKDRSSFFTHNRISYIIDCVYDPKKTIRFSLQEAIRTRIFVNGVYKNYIRNESYHIDEAITKGYIVGKVVDIDNIEDIFRSSLDTTNRQQFSEIRAPTKPTRGVFLEQHHNGEETLNTSRRSGRSKSSEKRRKTPTSTQSGDEGVLKSSIETFSGKVLLVQDLSTGKFLKPDEAEKLGVINFLNGTYENSLSGERIKISEAIERGFIIIEKFANENQVTPIRHRTTSATSQRRKHSVNKSASTYDNYDNYNQHNYANSVATSVDNNLDSVGSPTSRSQVELSQQFEILSVIDPVRKVSLELDEAIRTGLFDPASGMYKDPRSNKKLTMIDAIDCGLVKLTENNARFKTSYKLQIEEFDRNFVKHIRSHTLRYVVDPFTREIIPINVAALKGIVDLDDGTYNALDSIITFKDAYDQCLAFTVDDLNTSDSKRAKFTVQAVRKSTTGKNMSLKSALAKNWLNIDRRVYIDKQLNEEMSFSQALDLDLIVLKARDAVETDSRTSGIARARSAQDGFIFK